MMTFCVCEKLVYITVKNIVKDKNGILLNNIMLPAEKDIVKPIEFLFE